VQADSRAALDASRDGDVDVVAGVPFHQTPQRRRRGVAQRRVGADRGNGGDEEGVLGEIAVPDGVDAPVDGVEAAHAAPVLDGRSRDA
jgi:hypothetical protein